MSLSKFSFIIPEKITTKGLSVSQKEYAGKKKILLVRGHLNFGGCFLMRQPMKCSAKPLVRGIPTHPGQFFVWGASKNEVWKVAKNFMSSPASTELPRFTNAVGTNISHMTNDQYSIGILLIILLVLLILAVLLSIIFQALININN